MYHVKFIKEIYKTKKEKDKILLEFKIFIHFFHTFNNNYNILSTLYNYL
jgi:hypothetical protein